VRIFFEKRSVRDLRQAIADVKEESDSTTLRDDLVDMFSDDQVEEIERRLDTDDFLDFLDQIIEEWSEEESDEMLDLMTERLGEIGVELTIEDDDDDDDDDEDSLDEDIDDEPYDDEDDDDDY
jgi:hypothetical protein